MSNHCNNCNKEHLVSQYRCRLCEQWVCRVCFVEFRKLCMPCTFRDDDVVE